MSIENIGNNLLKQIPGLNKELFNSKADNSQSIFNNDNSQSIFNNGNAHHSNYDISSIANSVNQAHLNDNKVGIKEKSIFTQN